MNINWEKIKTKYRFRYSKKIKKIISNFFWFFTGAILTGIFLVGLGFFAYQKNYEGKIYPGVMIGNIDFGGKTQNQAKEYFDKKNISSIDTKFEFVSDYGIATISAKEINAGFDSNLLAIQAYEMGRSPSFLSNISILIQSYTQGIKLPLSYRYSHPTLENSLKDIENKINFPPKDAQFAFENGRVTTFRLSQKGQAVDTDKLNKLVEEKINSAVLLKSKKVTIAMPIKILEPKITTESINNLGIKELIGEGHSLFFHSIPSRIYNVNLGATRLNGVLVAPNEVFSFDKALGDVSSLTGYKQAYVIQNGHTVLGDGGGICQVSTTFFRALLNAGLPIVERHAHAYRVGYYEEDSPPGIDATIFTPSVDLKFKNDTGHYILVQSVVDLNNLSLAFYLYGVKDGRKVTMTTPVITSQTPPPPPLYQDDPNLPNGTIQQTDFEAWGANVYFTRTVTKNGKTIIADRFVSNYQPWQAVYLRGTKQ